MDALIIGIICVASLIISMMALYENDLFSWHKKNLFLILAGLIIVEICGDTFLLLIDGKKLLPNEVYKLLKILELVFVPAIPALFSVIIAHREFWKKIQKAFVAIFIANAIAQLTSFVFPTMFEYRNTTYIRTQYTVLYVGVILVTTVLFLICANKTFVQSRTISYTLVLTVILIMTGMLLRFLNISSNADWLCITLSYFIFLFYFGGIYLMIDPLTTLLNRKSFDIRMEKIKYNTAIIVIDCNNFKNINDTYGHIAGDKALIRIAKNIYASFGKYGYCYRIGGDEFCVILKKDSLAKLIDQTENFDAYHAVGSLINNLYDRLKSEAERLPMLSDGVACGFGIYTTPTDITESGTYKTIEEVLKIADERMYKRKERAKHSAKS